MRPDFTNLRNRTKITFMATIDSYRSPFPHEELLERARRIRHVALDMDGTIYMGMSLFPWTKRFLSDLTEMGIGYSFLTNNPSKSIADYLHKLETLGIEATREEMYTTALATIDYIRSHYPTAKRLFLLGTPSMISEFEAAGFESTADSADDVPDVVVAAFDMTLTYPRLCRAAWWASQGHEPRPRMSYRSARRAGRLRLDLQVPRTRHGTHARHRAGQTRSQHAHRHQGALRPARR